MTTFMPSARGWPVTILVGQAADTNGRWAAPTVNVTSLVDLFSIRVEETGNYEPASATFELVQKPIGNAIASNFPWFTDHILGNGTVAIKHGTEEVFQGNVTSWEPGVEGINRRIRVTCADVGALYDSTIIPFRVDRPAGESDRARIGYLLATFGTSLPIQSANLANVAVLDSSMPKQTISNCTLRQAIERVLGLASKTANYWIDTWGRLHTWDRTNPDRDGLDYIETAKRLGPASYFRLGEASGTFKDTIGSGYTLSVTTATSVTRDVTGALPVGDDDGAVLFTAGTARLSLSSPTAHSFNGRRPFSVAVWVRNDTQVSTNARIVAKEGTAAAGAGGWRLSANSAEQEVFFSRYTNATDSAPAAGAPLPIGAWTHVVGTYDGSNLRVYTNGVLVGSPVASTREINSTTFAMTVGHPTSAFIGPTDELLIFRKALSADEVARLYDSTSNTRRAPYEVVVKPTLSSEQIAPEDLRIDWDTSQLRNWYRIRGKTSAGSLVMDDKDSIQRYGRRQAFADAPDADTQAKGIKVGLAYLLDTASPTVRGSFSVSGTSVIRAGNRWRAGQTVRVTSPYHGLLREPYRIVRVTTTYLSGAGVRRMEIEFGARRKWLSGGFSS